MIEVDTPFGRFFAPRSDLITDQLVEFGAHQRGALNLLLSLVNRTDMVWDVGAHIGTAFDDVSAAGQIAVASATLDGVASAHPDLIPTLIKIDVEGHELAVLTGGEETFAAHRPLLLVEVSSARLEARLASLNKLQSWFDQHRYHLFQVGGERNFSGPTWELEALDALVNSPDPLFDVLAVPDESNVLDGIELRKL